MDRTDRPVTPEEEGRLSALFETLTPPLEDEGFSAGVVRRIRRRVWLRRAVLGTAVIIGGVLALGPLSELSVLISELSVLIAGLPVLLSEDLVTVATSWNDPAWLAQNRVALILVLLAVASPGAIRLLER
ncbi:MAG: hypothetical protein F4181_02070 [Proteobacteria bacterium]|nr:hypothetical protein [Pseudomonadota bacterium]